MNRPSAPPWDRFSRPVPAWFPEARFGIFVHWGAYSVPAWAEPTGELGTVDGPTWLRHNPYAEWYAHTIRLEGSPASEHHREVYGGAAYDDFLDAWHAEAFDPDDLVGLFARAGARYVVPTTKHHDGTPDVGRPTEEPWVRWTRTAQVAHAVVEGEDTVAVQAAAAALDLDRARLADGSPVPARAVADHVELDLPPRALAGPAVVDIPLREPITRTAGSRP
jgi:hypothetical protein